MKKLRTQVEDLLKRRFFVRPAFEIYEGVSGLYDYGPPGCGVKKALEDAWRRHFVLEEDMFEVCCTNLTPEICLKASGHVDRFTDFLVKELVKVKDSEELEEGRSFRADKLIDEFFQTKLTDPGTSEEEKVRIKGINAGTLSAEQLHQLITDFHITAPGSTNKLSFPEPFNLMFATEIGPTKKLKAFFRPETAQGIFVNFKHLYEQNGCKLPFAAAQIGLGFRNEISPRDGLLRVREFTMAEIEHFVNPNNKNHPKFQEVAAQVLLLLPREQQAGGLPEVQMTIGDAVAQGIVNNETLGYFMTRTYYFLNRSGVQSNSIRFRQHMKDEMSHYAKDCWDAEIFTTYRWVECVGIADRACYDLTQHAKFSKKNMLAAERCNPPKMVEGIDLKPNKGSIAKTHKAFTQEILKRLEELSEEERETLSKTLAEQGEVRVIVGEREAVLTREMLAPERVTRKITQETFYPSVIEPSFGIGRIIYAIFEHAFFSREQEGRVFLAFPPHIAPTKCSILPLSNQPEFKPIVRELRKAMMDLDLSTEVDDTSVSIGRRYARTDEVGIPFACTVDFQTVQDRTVTLRELISTRQVRVSVEALPGEVARLVKGQQTWQDIVARYPEVIRSEAD